MKTRKVYGSNAKVAQGVYSTIRSILMEAEMYSLDSDQITIDYMDAQALRRVLEREHDHCTRGLKKRCYDLYDIIFQALQRDFKGGSEGYVVMTRDVMFEILEVLDLYYSLHPRAGLEVQAVQQVEIEYWVDPDTDREMVEIRMPDGSGDIVLYDDIIYHSLWLIVYQDIKEHERMEYYPEVREMYSMKEWFRHIIQNHYFIKDDVPDSVHSGKLVEHHPEG